jgi:hypothetical protein
VPSRILRRTAAVPLRPVPLLKTQSCGACSCASTGSRKPRQIVAGAVPGLGRAASYATQSGFFDSCSDRLTPRSRNRLTIAVKWIRFRKSRSLHPLGRMYVAHLLSARKSPSNQDRAGIRTQIFGLVRPLNDKGTKIEAGCHLVFIEIQSREAAGWVPSPAAFLCVRRVEGVLPPAIGDPPPGPAVGDEFALERHGQC